MLLRSRVIRNDRKILVVADSPEVLKELQIALEQMKPGDICLYYRSTQEHAPDVLESAWNAYQIGLVKLMQRKRRSQDGDFYEYLAVRTGKSHV